MKKVSGMNICVALFAVLAVGFGGEVWAQEQNDRHKEAIAAIQQRGGRVNVDISPDGDEYTEVALSGGRSFYRWRGGKEGIEYLKELENLKRLSIQNLAEFGDEELANLEDIKSLETLFLGGLSVSDEGLRHVKGLEKLESLGLWSNNLITDKALEHIKDFKQLKSLRLKDAQITDAGLGKLDESGILAGIEILSLSRTAITDAGLEHLAGAEGLKVLSLEETRITDEGLENLANLEAMEELVLNKTVVSDAGLVHLKGLSKLRVLHLQDTKISDAGLAELKGLSKLEMLWLGDTKVTDPGLVNLVGLTELQSVDLASTRITDAGLVHLRGLGKLRELSLRQTDVTQKGYRQLRSALKGCKIIWEKRGPIRVGGQAPKLGIEQLLQAPKGAKADWESLKGNVVVLEFWATWCGPCIMSMPHMNELVEKFKNKPVKFLAITNEKQSLVKSFLAQREVSAWVGLDTDNSMVSDYGVKSIPYAVVVDKTGTIRKLTRPSVLSERFIEELLGE
ncbi:MAG: redoxin family protein [Planctomycetota bacterium]|jgi:thiol-disulfide isomerase/thioredoxin